MAWEVGPAEASPIKGPISVDDDIAGKQSRFADKRNVIVRVAWGVDHLIGVITELDAITVRKGPSAAWMRSMRPEVCIEGIKHRVELLNVIGVLVGQNHGRKPVSMFGDDINDT